MKGDLRSSNKFEEILSEFSRIQKLPQPYRDDDDNFSFPRQIAAENGRCITISKKIDQLIGDIARKMRNDSPMQNQFSPNDYGKLVRQTFGPALASINLDNDLTANAKAVQADVETSISDRVNRILNGGGLEYAFGCTLFSYEDFPPFEIGPVRFEPRLIWLDRKASDGCWAFVDNDGRINRFDHQIADGPISKTTKRRIMRAWDGQRLKKRKASFDSDCEKGVLNAIGECPYVCSVKIPALGNESSKDKALVAARLALTTLALIWSDSRKAVNGLNLKFDRDIHNQSQLSFTSDGLVQFGSELSIMPHAPFTPRENLEKQFQKLSDIFQIAGEAIDWLLKPSENRERRTLLSIITQALLWFQDGCRENFDLKAIVCFSACLDILASGGHQKGIGELIHARLGLNENATITRDDLTVKEVVKNIYDDGRNRFSHGPLDKQGKNRWKTDLGHDWSETRQIAEWLARLCLISCMDWMVKHPTCDDPNQLRQT